MSSVTSTPLLTCLSDGSGECTMSFPVPSTGFNKTFYQPPMMPTPTGLSGSTLQGYQLLDSATPVPQGGAPASVAATAIEKGQ